MNKLTAKEKLKGKIIAVIRCDDFELAGEISEKVINNGIDAIEITYTIKGAGILIRELKEKYPDKMIGAGTVTDIVQTTEAIENGVDFIVSPCLMEEIADFLKQRDILCSMAAVTPTEIFQAYRSGVDIIKLFPGEIYGPKAIKAFKGPFPFIEIMPTGGVDDKNIREWFKNGAYAVGVGSYLTGGVNFNNLDLIEKRIRNLVNAIDGKQLL